MKAIKGLSLFSGLVVLASSCFNPPEFPLEPKIEFESIYFAEAPDGSGKTDSLVVSVNFKDGDGDLGLDGSNPEHEEAPFNASNLFLANNGELIPVGLAQHWSDIPYYFVDLPADRPEGQLVTLKTKDLPGYGDKLPDFTANSCDYIADTVIMVDAPDAAILDPTFHNIVDTMTSQSFPSIYVLKDTFYIKNNPNHYNITVTILMKDGDNWTPYNSGECSPGFNGRFPVLSDKDDSPLEGTLRYSLKSFGFQIQLSTKTLKVQVQIKDRKLHTSNTVESPEFTLQKIRR